MIRMGGDLNSNNLLLDSSTSTNWLYENQEKMLKSDIKANSNRTNKSLFIVVDDNNSNLPEQERPKHGLQDLVHCFKYFLVFGRVIGVLPIKGFNDGQVEALRFRWFSLATLSNIIIVCGLAFSCFTGIVGFFKSHRDNVNDLTNNLGFFQFYGTGFFTYLYFLMYSRDLISILKKWSSTKFYYTYEDKTLRRDAHCVAALILVSIFFENFMWHMRAFTSPKFLEGKASLPSAKGTDFIDFLNHGFQQKNESDTSSQAKYGTFEFFYNYALQEWANVYQYNPSIAVFAVIINKFGLYAWNYYDILIIIVSRAIYKKYRILNEIGHKYLDIYEKQCELGTEKVGFSIFKWKQLIKDHLELTNLLSAFAEFFSPIVLVSYGANIYDLCMHISNGLSPSANVSLTGSIYSAWSFLHLSVRLFLVSLAAAKINEHAMNISKMLRRCPVELYTKDIKKFEIQLFHMNTGLGAFGSFVVTKPFMLQILGVVFTIEIVLLQQNSICDNTVECSSN